MRHFFFGRFVDLPGDLTIDEAERFFRPHDMKERSRTFCEVPIDEVISTLERVGKRLTEKGRYRDLIEKSMLEVTGYSPSMLKVGMDILEGLLSREALEDRISCLGDRRSLDGWIVKRGRPLRSLPLGSVCHVAPGNLFLGSIDSLVLGMITKNVNVLKLSRQDRIFPFIFLEALLEEDYSGEISSSIAITSWSHKDRELMNFIGSHFDGILLFGGGDAVSGYKDIASPSCKFMAFGPKLSWGLVRDGLSDEELDKAVRGFAMDVALWEQRACTSCQNLFVEGEDLALEVAKALKVELDRLSIELPHGRITLDEAVDIRKERERVFWDSYEGRGRLFEGSSHTVILGSGPDVIPSPLNRTVYVNAVGSYKDLLGGNLSYMTDHMSTVGLAVPDRMYNETIRNLEQLGVPRFCLPGTMGLGADGKGTHDGSYMALDMVKVVNREDISPDLLGRFYDDSDWRDRRTLAELNRLVSHAMKSSFYRELYKDVELPLRSFDDFSSLPILEKSHLEEHCPPEDLSMLTGPSDCSYIFSSGGTSGVPRRICWTDEEFRSSHALLGQGFRTLGIGKGDRVANLMKAGSLYTGFLAVNGGLEETGCQILSVTANQTVADTLDLLEELKPNVAMGMTSTLVEVAEAARREGRKISIDRLLYTGEAISDTSMALLNDVFGASVGSLSYGAVEIGPLGFQCDCCRHDEFHLAENWAYLEFGDDGEVFATGTDRLLHPIIRYRIGDRARWVEEPCRCGRTSPKFQLLGRTDYYVRLLYNDLYMVEIDRALSRFHGLSSAYQISLWDDGGVNVRLTVEGEGSKDVCDELWSALKEEASEFSDLDDFGCPFEIEIVQAGSIERVGRTGKIRRIIDHRGSH